MKNYSLKSVFYSNNNLLNEMAIITPRNFLEKVIKLCKEKPQLIGDPAINSLEEAFEKIEDNLYKKRKYLPQLLTNEFLYKLKAEYKEKEVSRQKSVEIRKNKGIKVNEKDLKPITLSEEEKEYKLELFEATTVKEKNIALEIIKIVHVTKLLELKGKENKKKLKEAEEVLIRQLRKHKNSDGEFIEFKKVLLMFDSIIQYIEKKVDVDFDTCIKAADIYMRSFYDLVKKEEKSIIDKGNFDFDIIMKRINFFNKYTETSNVSVYDSANNENKDVINVYEDEDIKVVYPTSYEAFRRTLAVDLNSKRITWCTYASAGTWYSYNSNKYVAIAHVKGSHPGDSQHAISLKVNKSGEINASETCDFLNDHVDEDFINEHFSEKAKKAIQSLPEIVDFKFSVEDLENNTIGLADLNHIEELKTHFTRALVSVGEEKTQELFNILCEETSLESKSIAEVVVESISLFMFNTPSGDFDYFRDFFNVDDVYPSKLIYDNLKEKMLDDRTHPRYLNAFLILDRFSTKNFDKLNYENFKQILEKACRTNNTNNLKRILKLIITSNNYSFYLNPGQVHKNKEGLTEKNLELYEILFNSKAVSLYVEERGVASLNNLSSTQPRNVDSFLSNLLFRFSDSLTAKIGSQDDDIIKEIDLNILISYLRKDMSSIKSFTKEKKPKDIRFLKLDFNYYQNFKNNLFKDYSLFETIKNQLSPDDVLNMYKVICNGITDNIIKASEDLFKIYNDLLQYNFINIIFIFDHMPKLLEVFNKRIEDLSEEAIINIIKKVSNSESSNVVKYYIDLLLLKDKNNNRFDYFYKIYKLLPENIQKNIAVKLLKKICLDAGESNGSSFDNIIAVLQSKSKVFFADLDFSSIIKNYKNYSYSLEGNESNIAYILCYLDFVPIEQKKEAFRAFMINVYINNSSTISGFSPSTITNNLDFNVINHKGFIDTLKILQTNIAEEYGKDRYKTLFMDAIIKAYTDNGLCIPKDVMQEIATKSNRQDHRTWDGIQTFFKNFLSISEDGSRYLFGKELSIARDTLQTLFRKKNVSSGNMFGTKKAKEIVLKIVTKMNKHARLHMMLAFPEESRNLSSNTPEEEAELQIESLVRQYVFYHFS